MYSKTPLIAHANVAVEVALFSCTPALGEVNPAGEVFYEGYNRVLVYFINGINKDAIEFPESNQDEPVYVEAAVALDVNGKVIGVRAIKEV